MEEADGNIAFIARALGNSSRTKGMAQAAYDAGVSQEGLYKVLSSERNPSFDTIFIVIGALEYSFLQNLP